MTKRIKRIPQRFIDVDESYRTKYLQGEITGKMAGRQGRKKGHLPKIKIPGTNKYERVIARTDSSPAAKNVRRIKAKTGIYGEHRGEIFGRTNVVKKHIRKSKKGKKHTVKKHKRKRR